MDVANKIAEKGLSPSFNFKIGELLFQPSYIQAFAIVFLIFLLVMTLARLRRMYVNWSLKGAMAMMFFGFMLAVIVEGFLIIGGRTALTELLGWKNAPKPIQTALDSGREKLVDVLGESTQEIPSSYASEPATYQSIADDIETLSPQEKRKLKEAVCTQ